MKDNSDTGGGKSNKESDIGKVVCMYYTVSLRISPFDNTTEKISVIWKRSLWVLVILLSTV